jgi:serine/threonine protein phosphatase PrpC
MANIASDYFDYGEKKVVVITERVNNTHCLARIENSKNTDMLLVALKIISIVLIILPLIMLGISAYIHWNNKVKIDYDNPKEPKLLTADILLTKKEQIFMPLNSHIRFSAAMKHYDKAQYKKALEEFSKLSLDLTLEQGEEAMLDIERAMEMTVASYVKFTNKTFTEIFPNGDEDLWGQFFHVMRLFIDNTEETDISKVEDEISKEIPLGVPEERHYSTEENKATSEVDKAGPYQAAISAAQGPRDEMEDTHLVTEIQVQRKGQAPQKIQFFGVFDGHGGAACAFYVKEILPEILKEELGKTSENDLEIYNALRRSFIKINRDWAALPFQQTEHSDYSGTTATVSLIMNKKDLWVANVGDSRTVLAEGKRAVQLSEEAKATVKKYEREIYIRGGEVQNGRVVGERGSLDMARSIGDIDQPAVSALPTIKKYNLETLKKENNYLILACDGLWDVVSPQMAAEVSDTGNSLEKIAKNLEKLAYVRGSTDNVSVMVVKI